MDSGQLDTPNEGDEDVIAVQRHQRQRPNLRSRLESDNERTNRQTAVPTTPAPRHANPRDRKPENEDTKQSALKKTRLLCYKCGGKGLVRLCPSADDCQDVDEAGTEQSSDSDSDLFGHELLAIAHS